jgi:hypothetical protein
MSIQEKEREKRMSKIEVYYSDCCGVEIVSDIAGLELCPRCWEHCDCVIEEIDDPSCPA